MKKKTREINIEENEYVYVINEKYHKGIWEITLTISLKKLRNITCSYHFRTWDDPVAGCPLLVGVSLKKMTTEDTEVFNLNHPKAVRQFVLYALENGWDRVSRVNFNDGLDIMSKMGYDVVCLNP